MLTSEFRQYPFASLFTTVSEANLSFLLSFVDRNYCQGQVWRTNPMNRQDALALITAHMGYLQWIAESDLAQKAIALREASGSGSSPQPVEEWLKLTIYGSQYLDLLNQVRASSSTTTRLTIPTGFAF